MRLTLIALLMALPLSAAAQAADGAKVFTANCVKCHGDDGRGQTEDGKKMGAPDLSSARWQSSRNDAQVRAAILEGSESGMPEFKGKLSKAEVDAVIRFVRGLGAADHKK